MSFGVVNPNLTLVQERFEPQGAVRIHHRLTPVDSRGTSSPSSSNSGYGAGLSQPRSGVPRFFMQSRRSVLESALFSGREKIGQVTEDNLELREVRVSTDKLYKKGLFARYRTWKGPDGVKYSWQTTEEGDFRMIDSKTNHCFVYVNRQDSEAVRLIIGAQILPFIELMLLTWIQHSFEYTKKVAELQAAEDDKDQQLGVW